MKSLTSIIALFLILASQTFSLSQEDKMQNILPLAGQWEVENYINQDNEWKNIGNTSSTIELVHEGRFISEKSKFLTAFGEINMITYIGFDSKQGRYKLTAMDKEYGLMDIYLGDWESDQLVFDNLKSDLPVKLDDGSEMHFRLTYKEIAVNSFTHLVEGTTDKGKSWFIFSKSMFKSKSK